MSEHGQNDKQDRSDGAWLGMPDGSTRWVPFAGNESGGLKPLYTHGEVLHAIRSLEGFSRSIDEIRRDIRRHDSAQASLGSKIDRISQAIDSESLGKNAAIAEQIDRLVQNAENRRYGSFDALFTEVKREVHFLKSDLMVAQSDSKGLRMLEDDCNDMDRRVSEMEKFARALRLDEELVRLEIMRVSLSRVLKEADGLVARRLSVGMTRRFFIVSMVIILVLFAAVAAAKRGDPELRMKIHTIINRRDHNLPGASSGTTTMSTSREMSSPDHELRNDAAHYIQRTERLPAPYQDSYDDRLIETFGLTLHRAANEFRCQVNVDGMSTNPTQSARSTEVGGVPFGRDYDASVAGHTVDPRPRSKVSGIASNPTRYSGNGEVERAPPDRAHAPSDVDCIVDHRSGSIADVTMVPHHPAQYSGSTEVGRVPFDRDHALSTCAGGPIVDPHSGSNADVAMLSRDSAQYLGDVEVEKVLSGCDPAAGHTVDPCPPSDVIGIATNPTQYSGSTEVTAQTDKAERVPFDRHAAEQPVLQVSNSSPHGEIRGRQGDAVTSQATESMSQYMVSDEEFDKMELLYPESDSDQEVGTEWFQGSTELAGDTQLAMQPVQPDTAVKTSFFFVMPPIDIQRIALMSEENHPILGELRELTGTYTDKVRTLRQISSELLAFCEHFDNM
ncbi:hypothetical protein BV25DRAFT_1843257 [Artomyces pyxidatus]|uniref:Uncharacterized protein n=1 Tax=Artomyces pyxidatus TaxID=48021 RepID=A0ACB8SFH8_9AGAM|nr:hypothetical protein BV25DRAFT_1843257 [Artomyces pyxidatus]